MPPQIKTLKEASEIIVALWHFIENCTDDDPERNDKFFALRERVRNFYASENPREATARTLPSRGSRGRH